MAQPRGITNMALCLCIGGGFALFCLICLCCWCCCRKSQEAELEEQCKFEEEQNERLHQQERNMQSTIVSSNASSQNQQQLTRQSFYPPPSQPPLPSVRHNPPPLPPSALQQPMYAPMPPPYPLNGPAYPTTMTTGWNAEALQPKPQPGILITPKRSERSERGATQINMEPAVVLRVSPSGRSARSAGHRDRVHGSSSTRTGISRRDSSNASKSSRRHRSSRHGSKSRRE